ncbi:MAG: hypothetical protein HS108_08025 [Planctomycetes bacterium]|jgi:hypothetical protein|nr:hypothetical protein [Planctomycetota bacterium]
MRKDIAKTGSAKLAPKGQLRLTVPLKTESLVIAGLFCFGLALLVSAAK